MKDPFLSDFKVSIMKKYDMNTNLQEHLTTYYFHMYMLGVNDEVMCQAFFSIQESATNGFRP